MDNKVSSDHKLAQLIITPKKGNSGFLLLMVKTILQNRFHMRSIQLINQIQLPNIAYLIF